MRASSTALRVGALAGGGAHDLHLVEPAQRDGTQKHGPGQPRAGEAVAGALREQAIREITMLSEFQAEVFDPVMRRWVPGFAVHSEFPRPCARALHAAALRRRGFANEQIAEALHVKRNRVSLLAWRGEGFLMCVEGATAHEEARLEGRRRL